MPEDQVYRSELEKLMNAILREEDMTSSGILRALRLLTQECIELRSELEVLRKQVDLV